MLTDDLLKDILFQDKLFETAKLAIGLDPLYDQIETFVSGLAFQLRTLDRGEKWRGSVTALVIRGKKRLRELEALYGE